VLSIEQSLKIAGKKKQRINTSRAETMMFDPLLKTL